MSDQRFRNTAPAGFYASKDAKDVIDKFAGFDLNKDGAIDRQELGAVLKSLDRTWDTARLDRLFTVCDLNADGRIDYSEFTKWVFATPQIDTKDLRSFRSAVAKSSNGPSPKLMQRTSRPSSGPSSGQSSRTLPTQSRQLVLDPPVVYTRTWRTCSERLDHHAEWTLTSSTAVEDEESLLEQLVGSLPSGDESNARLFKAANRFLDVVLSEHDLSSINENEHISAKDDTFLAILGPVLYAALHARRRVKQNRSIDVAYLECDDNLNQDHPLGGNRIVQLKGIHSTNAGVCAAGDLYLLTTGNAFVDAYDELQISIDHNMQFQERPFKLFFGDDEAVLAMAQRREKLAQALLTLGPDDELDLVALEQERQMVIEDPKSVQTLLDQRRCSELAIVIGSSTANRIKNFRELLLHLRKNEKQEVKRMVEGHEVDLSNLDNRGQTALHHARSITCARYLLENGPKNLAEIRDTAGHTAAEHSLAKGVNFAQAVLDSNPGALFSIGANGISAAMRLSKKSRMEIERMLPPWEEWSAAFMGGPQELSGSLEAMGKRLADAGIDVGEESSYSTLSSVLHFMFFGEHELWEKGEHTDLSIERLTHVRPALVTCINKLDEDPAAKNALKTLLGATRGPKHPALDPREPHREQLDAAVNDFIERTRTVLSSTYDTLVQIPDNEWLTTLEDRLLVPGIRLRQDCSAEGCPSFDHPDWVWSHDFAAAFADLAQFGTFGKGKRDVLVLAELTHTTGINELPEQERSLMVLDAMMRREICQSHVSEVKMFFVKMSEELGCEVHARDSAKAIARILVKAKEAVKELLGNSSTSVERKHLQTAGDYVVDVNGVELVSKDMLTFQKVYRWFENARWETEGAQLLRVKNGFKLTNAESPSPDFGYRDLKVWVLVRIAGLPLVVEVQLHLEEFHRKKPQMHVVYKYKRGDFDFPDEEEESESEEDEGSEEDQGEDDDQDERVSQATTEALINEVELHLKSGGDPDSIDARGNGFLTKAIDRRALPALQQLLEAKADPNLQIKSGNTALHVLAKKGFRHATARDALIALTSAGANVNLPNGEGWTPLHFAAKHSSSKNAAVIGELLLNNADVNASTHGDEVTTALHLACRFGCMDAVSSLVSHKARVDALDGHGKTPLFFAAARPNLDMVERLLGAKASPSVVDSAGKRALDYVPKGAPEELLQLLREEATSDEPE